MERALSQINRIFAEKAVVLMFVMSAAVSVDNMHLAALPLVVIQLAQYVRTRYICAVAGVAFFALTVARTAFYIPCMAFVMVYIVADYLQDSSGIKAVYPAAVVFAVAKAYVLSFGFDTVWWLVLVLETAAIITGADMVQAGFDILNNNDTDLSAENIAEAVAALGMTAFAFCAVPVWAFSPPAVFLLSAAFFYGRKNNMAVSLAAFALAVLSLCGDKNFALMAVGLFVIYLATAFMLSRGRWGYTGGVAVAMAVAVVSVSRFNSLVFVSMTAVSLLAAFGAERAGVIKNRRSETCTETAGQAQTNAIMEKVDRLNRCFRFLGHTIIDISAILGQDYIPPSVDDTVCKEVCRRCKNNTYCWQQKYSDTQAQFSRCADAVSAGRQISFDSWFYSQCDKTEQLVQAFQTANRLATTQKLLHSAAVHSRTMLQGQFIAMADILRDITTDAVQQGMANTAYTHTASSFLTLCGKKTDYCICYQNPDRCVVKTRDFFTQDEIYRFRAKLESVYSCRFDQPVTRMNGDSMIYTFCSVPLFRADCAIKTADRQGECGDVCESFTSEGYTYIVLADGMGTGSFAAAESRTATAMLKSLLTSSVNAETAIAIVNIALNLKGTGQSCVALDILQINLYDGSCMLYKAGGADTIAISGGRVQHIYRDSLPVGILKDTGIAQFSFTMNNGDVLIITSDGVEITDTVCKKLRFAVEKCTVSQLCDCIIKETKGQDDATVAAVRLERV